MADLDLIAWLVLAVAAFSAGFSKSAIPAISTISVVLGAAVIPARESTGMLLLMLILGDGLAVWTYSRSTDWRLLLRLAPMMLAGVGLGVVFLAYADDRLTAITIGAVLIGLILLTLWQRAHRPTVAEGVGRHLQGALYGTLGGFTTMVANVGAPAISLYFLSRRLDVHTFLGSAAWLFAISNLIKLPFSIGLGLVTLDTVTAALILLPLVAAGFFAGRVLIKRINQQVFDRLIMGATILGATYLILAPN